MLVASGIYWEDGYRGGDASLNKESVACNPANSGTAGNPITFIGVGMPQLRMQENARGGVIGANNRSYIVWDGFDIDDTYCGSASDFGPVVLDVGAHHVTVQNCQIQGHNGSYYWGYATYDGNYRLVALEDVYNCTIRNNKISRALIGASPGGQNEAGVMSYDSHDNVIEQNTITNCGSGIFIKGVHPGDDQSSNVVRYNLIYACHSAGIRVLDAEPDGDTRVYQNILIDTSTGIWAGFSYSRASKFYNNVIYSTDRGRVGHGTDLIDVEFRNSIVMSCTAASYDFSANVPSGQDVFYERNLYYNNTRIWSSESGNNASTLAAWQAYGAMCDANGASGDPLFINASTNPAVADFHLDTSSPAEELGRDYYGTFGGDSTTVIPAGAYVTGSEQIGADW